jgi:GAF domain-containing protein
VSSQKLAEEQQAKTLRELERKLDQLQALYQIAKDMTNPSDLDSLVRGTMEHLRRLMRADYVLLYRAEQDPQGQQLLRLMAQAGAESHELYQYPGWRPGESSVTGLAAATGRLVVVKDISEFPYQPETRKALEDLGVRSLLGLPLQADGQLLGVVNALWCQPVEIDDEMVALFQTLANLLSTGLRNSQLLEDTVAQARRLAALYEVATAINSRASLSPIFQTALEQVVSLLAADRGEIALIDSDGNTFTVVAEYGEGTLSALGRKIPVHTPLEKRLVKDRVPVAIPDLANCPELGSAAALPLSLGIRAMLIVPIIAGDRVIGTMGIDSMKARQFTGDDVSVAQAIAHQISVALERAHLLEVEREKASELGVLFALSRELSEISHSVEAVLGTVTKRAVTDLPCTTAMALLAEGDEITLGASYRRRALRTGFHPGDRRPLKAYPTLLRASASPEPYLLTRGQALTPEEKRDLFPATVEHLCILPLRVSDRLLGFLVLGEARSALREPFGPSKLKLARAMADQAASALSRAQLFHRLEESYLQTVLALAKAVEAKDTYTADHAQRIAELAVAVGAEMGLSQQELEDLRYGAILHDVGKLAVPDGILRKAGPLDQEEWAIIRRHPAIGAEILGSVKRLEGTARVVRHHHERFDGRGYPDGLAGEAIPLGSRILAVVDAFIAMTDERVYRAPKSPQEALDELDRNAGTQFDPQVVKVFKRVLRRSSQIPEKSRQSSVLLSS